MPTTRRCAKRCNALASNSEAVAAWMLSLSLVATAPPLRRKSRHRIVLAALMLSLSMLTACMHAPRTPAGSAQAELWSGRLSLQVHSEPVQSFSAGFELKGSPEKGELLLSSPLGNTLLAARWTPLEAVLEEAGKTRKFSNIDALIEQSTGAALPVAALFDWLHGKPGQQQGWTADLGQLAQGRISAQRSKPLPRADLRIVLNRPAP
jgi:outer membrane lipoprotein LolB